jgi:tetratricopeptide (TPR) repeat protein
LSYFEQSLAIRKKVYGDEHTDVAASLNNIGVVLRDLGKYQGALSYCEQSLAIKKKVYGPEHEHTDVARILNNMSGVLDALGRREDAARARDEASKIA